MISITSKRHPLKFYTLLFVATLFFLGLGTMLVLSSIHVFQGNNVTAKAYFIPFGALALYALAFIMVSSYWKNAPKIILNQKSIQFGKEVFPFDDIRKVELTGKFFFKLILPFRMEGTAVYLKDGTEKVLFNDFYSNSAEIQYFLEQVLIKKVDFKPYSTKKVGRNDIRFETIETFKGNQFTSFRGIVTWSLILVLIFSFIFLSRNQSLSALTFAVTFGIFWVGINSWLLFYFGVSKDYLVVRNHNYFWMVKVFRLTDLKEVIFESEGQQPNCLRIITKDFKNKFYPAGTLRDHTWLEMKKLLESKGVKVRNECIPEV